MVPLEYSVTAYQQAQLYPDVQPQDLIAIMVAEHGGGYPYPVASVGKASEVGLLQLTGYEVRPYNKAHDTSWTVTDMHDPILAITVGAWSIQRIKNVHKTKARCLSKVREHTVAVDGNGVLVPVLVERPRHHNWHAHWRCSVKARDALNSQGKPVCKTGYRVRLVKRFTY